MENSRLLNAHLLYISAWHNRDFGIWTKILKVLQAEIKSEFTPCICHTDSPERYFRFEEVLSMTLPLQPSSRGLRVITLQDACKIGPVIHHWDSQKNMGMNSSLCSLIDR